VHESQGKIGYKKTDQGFT